MKEHLRKYLIVCAILAAIVVAVIVLLLLIKFNASYAFIIPIMSMFIISFVLLILEFRKEKKRK